MQKFLRRLAEDKRGATAIEYGLIVALIVLAMFSALAGVGTETIALWSKVADQYERNLPAAQNN
jgi:pilus assembly protein Flp/PilA